MKGLWNYPPDHVGAKEEYWKKESLSEKDPYDNDIVSVVYVLCRKIIYNAVTTYNVMVEWFFLHVSLNYF